MLGDGTSQVSALCAVLLKLLTGPAKTCFSYLQLHFKKAN